MIYITTTDLCGYIEEQKLNEITDFDLSKLDKLELRAMAEMTAYLSIRYDAAKCFDPTSRIDVIVAMLCDIVLYHAHAAIMPDMIPKIRVERYRDCIDWLKGTAGGFIAPSLPLKEDEPTGPLRYGNSSDKQDMYY